MFMSLQLATLVFISVVVICDRPESMDVDVDVDVGVDVNVDVCISFQRLTQ